MPMTRPRIVVNCIAAPLEVAQILFACKLEIVRRRTQTAAHEVRHLTVNFHSDSLVVFHDGLKFVVGKSNQFNAFVSNRSRGSSLSIQERQKYVQDVVADDWGVRVVLKSSAVFGTRSDKFKEDALPFLKKIAEMFAKTKRKLLVEGHVAKGETGTFGSTWEFASARAINMTRFVQKTQGLDANQFAVASLADSKPIFDGANAPKNSRLEIVVLNQDMEF